MKNLKAILLLLLVFIAGITVGSVATRYFIKRDIRRAVVRPELVRLRIERELTRELDLTPAQQTRLGNILVTLQQDIARARKERNHRIRPIFQQAQNSIHEMLNQTQQEKFERYLAEYGIFSLGNRPDAGQHFPRLQKLKEMRNNKGHQPPAPRAQDEPLGTPKEESPPAPDGTE